MRKCLLLFVCLFVSLPALAVKNLPLTCAKPVTTDNKCPEWQCIPGAKGLMTATPENVWKLWENIPLTDKIRVWENDLNPGTCSGARIAVTKANAISDQTILNTRELTVTWTLPTKLENGKAIAPTNPIDKVVLIYALNTQIPDEPNIVTGGYNVVELAGTATEYKRTVTGIPGTILYVRAKVILKLGEESELSTEATWTVPVVYANPLEPTGISINDSEPTDQESSGEDDDGDTG